ncbi:hypothetical protein [uncultured Sphingomonas sp.]|nr:hypothetical protein [uncultured Sphingomonas sp.]
MVHPIMDGTAPVKDDPMPAPNDPKSNAHSLLEHDPLYILLDRDFRRMKRMLSWRRRNSHGIRQQRFHRHGAAK